MEPGVAVRPVWSMSGSDMLTALDTLHTTMAAQETYRLQLLAGIDQLGYAKELGARDTIELLALRHRLDSSVVRRDLKLATALPKYPSVTAALPDPFAPTTADDTIQLSDPAPTPASASTCAPTSAPASTSAPVSVFASASLLAAAGVSAAEPTAEQEGGSDGVGEAGDGEAVKAGAGRLPVLLHVAQAEAIVSSLEKIPTAAMVPVEDLHVAEDQMVKAARHLCPADLRKLGKQVRETLDTDGPEPGEDAAYRKETLWLKKADHGLRFGGYLAGENAELFHTLIHAGAKPHKTVTGELDPRPRDKRQADALTTILNTAAATGDAAPSHGGIKPHITITIDLNDLKSATTPPTPHSTPTPPDPAPTGTPDAHPPGTADAHPPDTTNPHPPGTGDACRVGAGDAHPPGTGDGRSAPASGVSGGSPASAGSGGASSAGWRAGGGGELVFGDRLSAAAVRRIACDAGIIPIVLGSNSEPLDVGRENRFVTGPIRTALNQRDQGCIICQAPPSHCDAHHLIHWADNGPTALDNLILACKGHHREIHNGHWTIQITNGIPHANRPAWADPPPARPRAQTTAQPASRGDPPDHRNDPGGQPPGWSPDPARLPGTALPPNDQSADSDRPGQPTDTNHTDQPTDTNHTGHPPVPTRAWPWTGDIPWITKEEIEQLNPWGDLDDPPTPARHPKPTPAMASPAW